MIQAVLFDIDGVLLDSFEANLKFFQDILGRGGYPRPNRREFRRAFHLPLVPALQQLSKADLTEEMERLHEIIIKVPYHFELLSEPPHTREMLETLSKDYKLGIVTSRDRDGVSKRYFPFSHAEKYFSVCITRADVTHCKPHPKPLLFAAKFLDFPPSECVYVGDSHTDIEAGKAAGMKTVLFGTKKNSDADITIASFKKLPVCLKRLG